MPVGNYSATTFLTTANGVTTNQISAGATLTITLTAQGTTTGQLFIPGANGGADFNADLAGTWSRSGDTVTFQQEVDTFLSDMPLTIAANQLVGDATFSNTRIQLTLARA